MTEQINNTESITITQEALKQWLMEWSQEARDGKCMPRTEAEKLSVEKLAELVVVAQWTRLKELSI